MANAHNKSPLEKAADIWGKTDVLSLLAEAAIAIGAGTPTDAGVSWTLNTTVESLYALIGGFIGDKKPPVALVISTIVGTVLVES